MVYIQTHSCLHGHHRPDVPTHSLAYHFPRDSRKRPEAPKMTNLEAKHFNNASPKVKLGTALLTREEKNQNIRTTPDNFIQKLQLIKEVLSMDWDQSVCLYYPNIKIAILTSDLILDTNEGSVAYL